MKRAKTRILVVDDHALVREGLKAFINLEPDMEVVGTASGICDALEFLNRHAIDFVILDLSLGQESGFDLLPKIGSLKTPPKVLVVSMYKTAEAVRQAVARGAHGFILKEENAEIIPRAIRRVLAGEVFLSEKAAWAALAIAGEVGAAERPAGAEVLALLSDRERQVFRLLGEGRQVRDIALAIGLSFKTVNAHRENIKQKLGMKSSAELIACAARLAHLP